MTPNLPSFNAHAVEPIECLKEGWALIKNRYWLYVGVTLVGLLIGGVVPLGILMGPMMCGIYLMLLQEMRGRSTEFSTLFKGFDYFIESLIATLIQFIPVFVLLVPFYAVFGFGMAHFVSQQQKAGGQPGTAFMATFSAGMALFAVFAIIIGIAIGVLFSFSYPLIVDRRLKGLQAIQASFKAALANFWSLVGLLLLNGLLGIAGAFCCYIGTFLVTPIIFAGLACAYRRVFGLAPDPSAPPPFPPANPGTLPQ